MVIPTLMWFNVSDADLFLFCIINWYFIWSRNKNGYTLGWVLLIPASEVEEKFLAVLVLLEFCLLVELSKIKINRRFSMPQNENDASAILKKLVSIFIRIVLLHFPKNWSISFRCFSAMLEKMLCSSVSQSAEVL